MTLDGADAKDRAAEVPLDAALKSERAQFELAERAARFGYWRVRLADNHTVWSPGMYRLIGVDPGQKADTAWLLAQIVPEDVEHLRQKINEAIKARAPFYYRTRAKDPSSQAQFVDTHGEVEIGPDGRVVSVIGVCHDVTQQVIAENARAEAEQMYRVMTEEASDIIMLYGADGKIRFVSDALWRLLARSGDEIAEGRYLGLVHPDDLQEAQKIAVQPAPGETRTAAYRIRHRDGHYVWIEATTRGVYDANGEYQHVISVSRDISERKTQELKMKAAQEFAEAANRAKSGFLANMSHELRTPLNAIIGFSDIMREELFGKLGDRRYSEYASLIRESGQLLLDLITDILDMAKIEAGKMELHIEPVDLDGTIEDCVHLLRARAQNSGIKIDTDLQAGLSGFRADRRAVKQILLNLLSNAVKFSLAGGRICVQTKFDDDRLVLSVIDEGVGIPADQLPRLGRPFEQASADPMLTKGGTGLGLALVQALAQKHGGAMRIASEEGIGTTVTVELPLKTAQNAAA
jgi:PAS domain S-box-containing protein